MSLLRSTQHSLFYRCRSAAIPVLLSSSQSTKPFLRSSFISRNYSSETKMEDKLFIRYAEEFNKLSLGHGLLHPCPASRLHPGVVGYYDDDGDWKTILDLSTLKKEDGSKYTAIENLPPPPSEPPARWEMKCSSDVTQTHVKTDAGAGVPEVKAKISDTFQFSKKADFGAVLIPHALVHQDYYGDDSPFYTWLSENYTTLLSSLPQLFANTSGFEKPLWIITKTYHTPACSVACWSGSQSDISMNLKFDVPETPVGGGDVDPDVGDVTVRTSGPGWTHYGIASEQSSAVIPGKTVLSRVTDLTGTDSFVMFASGLKVFQNKSWMGKAQQSIRVESGFGSINIPGDDAKKAVSKPSEAKHK